MAGLPVLVAAMVAGHGSVTHVVEGGETLGGIAQQYGTDVATLARSNRLGDPDRLWVGQRLAVPPASSQGRGGGGDGPRGSVPAHVTYTVRSGDTVSGIAARAGIGVAAVLAANDLAAGALIHPGQRLALPGVRIAAADRAPRRPRPAVHRVVPGDTVGAVAARYGVDVDAVLRANHLHASTVIHPGRKLVLPGARSRARAAVRVPATHGYTIRRGDTLSSIAMAARVSLAEVFALNHLGPASVLQPGRRILLPGRGQTASGASPDTSPGTTTPRAGAVRTAAAGNRAALAGRAVPGRARVRSMIVTAARRLGVDPALAQAVAYQESGFNQRAVSSANAIGAMQVIPSSGRWASDLVGRPLDLLDARDNVVAGVAILAALTAGNPEPTAIAAYYQGLGSVTRDGMYADTRRYVANVQTLKARFR